jgi:putative ubiquitin-RnfH superfamily antitoxin RatB of RatAB toxin-antitoxin module
MVNVEVIYHAASEQLIHYHLQVSEKSSISDVLEKCGIYERCPETSKMPFGVFGKKVPGSHVVRSGDRIEIYRPLSADPKEKRRQKALSC